MHHRQGHIICWVPTDDERIIKEFRKHERRNDSNSSKKRESSRTFDLELTAVSRLSAVCQLKSCRIARRIDDDDDDDKVARRRRRLDQVVSTESSRPSRLIRISRRRICARCVEEICCATWIWTWISFSGKRCEICFRSDSSICSLAICSSTCSSNGSWSEICFWTCPSSRACGSSIAISTWILIEIEIWIWILTWIEISDCFDPPSVESACH